MSSKPTVFISSTSDLTDERSSVGSALRPHCEPYLYEEDRGGRESPRARCARKIGESDLFLVLLGPNFGSPLPEDAEQRSIVEWEVDTAMSRADLEIMPFLRRDLDRAVTDPRQRRVLAKVRDFRSGLWCKFFSSSQDLVAIVRDSMIGWLVEEWPRIWARRTRRREGRIVPRIALTVALVAALGALLVGLTPIASGFSSRSLLVFSVSAGVTVLVCSLLWLQYGGRHAGTE